MKQDCYWYIEDEKLHAICVECNKEKKEGWYWPGSKLGYGDYDLNCSKCNKELNKKYEVPVQI